MKPYVAELIVHPEHVIVRTWDDDGVIQPDRQYMPRPRTVSELEPVVRAAAEAMDDLLQMLGVDPKETPNGEAGNDYRTVAEVLAGAAVRGAFDKLYEAPPDPTPHVTGDRP